MKYFKYQDLDDNVKIFSFVGRITEQKGVHFICYIMEDLIKQFNYKIQFLIGGAIVRGDKYGENCKSMMLSLKSRFPNNFWCDPDGWFSDGPMMNVGSDFCMMPSEFEPGGIV